MLTHKGTQTITTPRLILRRYRDGDAASAFAHFASDERVTRFLSWQPYTNVEALESFIRDCVRAYTADDVYHWAIELGGAVVGSISVTNKDERNAVLEMGYCIGCDFWGKGYMSEALGHAMSFLFNEVNAQRIWAKHDADNPSSGKVMLKCGMRYEGRTRGFYHRHDGSRGDALVYGVLRGDRG